MPAQIEELHQKVEHSRDSPMIPCKAPMCLHWYTNKSWNPDLRIRQGAVLSDTAGFCGRVKPLLEEVDELEKECYENSQLEGSGQLPR